MRRAAAAVALASAVLLGAEASAQGLFDLFGFDRPARAPAGAPSRARREAPRATEKKRSESKSKKKRENARSARTAPAKPEAKSAEPPPPPPYEAEMTRLAEVLGAVAFLRDLCGAADGEDWRGKMSLLLDAEAPEGPRRDALVASFNRGFRGFELTYRVCTPNAEAAAARYLDEAARISRDITYRFGSP